MRIAVITLVSVLTVGCTSILGDFEVESREIGIGSRSCESDDDCDKNFYPGSVCIKETGRCHAYIDGGPDGGDGSDQ